MRILQNCKLRDIAGEKMLIVKSGGKLDFTKVVLMNGSAQLLYNELKDKSFTSADAAALLVNSYGIDAADALRDSSNWIESMTKAGLITE